MFMTQNASLETVTTRMYKRGRNVFMLRALQGVILFNECASRRDRSWKGMDCRARRKTQSEESQRCGRDLGRKGRSEREDVVYNVGAATSGRALRPVLKR